MREKKRYLLLRGNDLRKNVGKAVLDGIGAIGASRAGLEWVKDNVIAVNRKSLNEIRACFAIFPGKIQVSRVSGSLKNLN